MGRIRTRPIKKIGDKLLASHKDSFSPKFEDNKKLVTELADIPTKKLRNLIAGYVTKKLKSAE
jgi:small subunit ribosomal protein S17e